MAVWIEHAAAQFDAHMARLVAHAQAEVAARGVAAALQAQLATGSPGRQAGQRPSDRKAEKVIQLSEGGLSYRLIGRQVALSKNTVGDIVKRNRVRKA